MRGLCCTGAGCRPRRSARTAYDDQRDVVLVRLVAEHRGDDQAAGRLGVDVGGEGRAGEVEVLAVRVDLEVATGAPLDQPVGEEGQRRAGRQVDLLGGPRQVRVDT